MGNEDSRCSATFPSIRQHVLAVCLVSVVSNFFCLVICIFFVICRAILPPQQTPHKSLVGSEKGKSAVTFYKGKVRMRMRWNPATAVHHSTAGTANLDMTQGPSLPAEGTAVAVGTPSLLTPSTYYVYRKRRTRKLWVQFLLCFEISQNNPDV